MRVLTFVILTFSLLSILTSCSYKQDQLLFEQKSRFDTVTMKNNNSNVTPYQIKPQDILQIRNLQNINYITGDAASTSSTSSGSSSTSGGQDFQVEEDGSVALPVIGHVQVAGLTRLEAANKIEGLYRNTLLKDPIIDIKIMNLKVTVLGEVKTPGNYALIKDKTTLIEVLGQAGGLTDRADEKTLEIIRGDFNHPIIAHIDLGDIRSLANPVTNLQNGDIIYIAQNKRVIQTTKASTFSTLVQPALIILSSVLLIITLARH
jgi:polysaccharide biosynthesis/export protein